QPVAAHALLEELHVMQRRRRLAGEDREELPGVERRLGAVGQEQPTEETPAMLEADGAGGRDPRGEARPALAAQPDEGGLDVLPPVFGKRGGPRPQGGAVAGLQRHHARRRGEAAGGLRHQLPDLLRLQRGAERQPHVVQAVQLAAAALQPCVMLLELATEAVLGEEVLDREVQVLHLPWLLDVAVQAGVVDRVDGGVEPGLAGEEDLHDARPGLVHALEKAVALHLRHDLVANDQLHLVAGGEDLVDELERLLGRLGALHAVGGAEAPAELRGELVEDRLLVVDANDVRGHGSASGSAATTGVRGKRTSKQVRPGSESTRISPRWRWTICWAIPSPNPVPSPWSLVVKNGSKMRPRIVSGMPGPVSVIRTATPSSVARVSIVSRPTPFIAWMALWMTLVHTWFSSLMLHTTGGRRA